MQDAYWADVLGVSIVDVWAMDYETVNRLLGYHTGKNLAEWARHNSPQGG